jgi:hypothetical protein
VVQEKGLCLACKVNEKVGAPIRIKMALESGGAYVLHQFIAFTYYSTTVLNETFC